MFIERTHTTASSESAAVHRKWDRQRTCATLVSIAVTFAALSALLLPWFIQTKMFGVTNVPSNGDEAGNQPTSGDRKSTPDQLTKPNSSNRNNSTPASSDRSRSTPERQRGARKSSRRSAMHRRRGRFDSVADNPSENQSEFHSEATSPSSRRRRMPQKNPRFESDRALVRTLSASKTTMGSPRSGTSDMSLPTAPMKSRPTGNHQRAVEGNQSNSAAAVSHSYKIDNDQVQLKSITLSNNDPAVLGSPTRQDLQQQLDQCYRQAWHLRQSFTESAVLDHIESVRVFVRAWVPIIDTYPDLQYRFQQVGDLFIEALSSFYQQLDADIRQLQRETKLYGKRSLTAPSKLLLTVLTKYSWYMVFLRTQPRYLIWTDVVSIWFCNGTATLEPNPTATRPKSDQRLSLKSMPFLGTSLFQIGQ